MVVPAPAVFLTLAALGVALPVAPRGGDATREGTNHDVAAVRAARQRYSYDGRKDQLRRTNAQDTSHMMPSTRGMKGVQDMHGLEGVKSAARGGSPLASGGEKQQPDAGGVDTPAGTGTKPPDTSGRGHPADASPAEDARAGGDSPPAGKGHKPKGGTGGGGGGGGGGGSSNPLQSLGGLGSCL